jgi:hypothetical protein
MKNALEFVLVEVERERRGFVRYHLPMIVTASDFRR